MRIWLLLALGACAHTPEEAEEAVEAPPAHVTCAPARRETLTDVAVLRGTIAVPPLAEAVVASLVPGRIASITVSEGDVVAARQVIATVEDPTLGATSAEAAADADAARVELRSATTERARTEQLFAQGLVAQHEVDDARAREDAAKATVASAQARARLARGQLARTDLRAPRAGTVLRVPKRAGDLVDAGDPIVAELADISVLELRAQVTGAQLIGLAPRAAATVTLDALPGEILAGEIVAVAPAIDPATSLGTVRIALAPTTLRPALGLAGAAAIPGAPRATIVVPAAALRRSVAGADELLVCAGDHVEVRAVTLGVRRPDIVEVRAGVAEGDAVVTDHVLGLEDGAAIAP